MSDQAWKTVQTGTRMMVEEDEAAERKAQEALDTVSQECDELPLSERGEFHAVFVKPAHDQLIAAGVKVGRTKLMLARVLKGPLPPAADVRKATPPPAAKKDSSSSGGGGFFSRDQHKPRAELRHVVIDDSESEPLLLQRKVR